MTPSHTGIQGFSCTETFLVPPPPQENHQHRNDEQMINFISFNRWTRRQWNLFFGIHFSPSPYCPALTVRRPIMLTFAHRPGKTLIFLSLRLSVGSVYWTWTFSHLALIDLKGFTVIISKYGLKPHMPPLWWGVSCLQVALTNMNLHST